jgi:soluble lytic murein transglycosylase-like protein
LIASPQYQEEEVINSLKNNLFPTGTMERIVRPGDNQPAVDGRSAFDDLLRNYIQKDIKAVSASGEAPPLDKNELALLVKNIQLQMNRHLFNAVFSSGNEINFSSPAILPQYINATATLPTDASKNRQSPPKNNINPQGFNLEPIIIRAARKYEVDPDLIRSVIKAESNFDSQATSPKGAMGLMQLMPETAKDLGVKNAYNAEDNIMGGTRYLKSLLERYKGNIDLTLAAYNWGMGNVEKKSGQMPAETVSYVATVNNYYKSMKA